MRISTCVSMDDLAKILYTLVRLYDSSCASQTTVLCFSSSFSRMRFPICIPPRAAIASLQPPGATQ